MNKKEDSQLVVCSVMVRPARVLFFYKFRTWLDQIVRIVVHTFVVEAARVPLNTEDPDGYWYCAGDFCDIDEAGVTQFLVDSDIDFAKCLVAPNIRDDDPIRPEKVIEGEYGIHYVCHNIANRVLFACEGAPTLIDLDIPVTGYEVVVKSTLGIFGQNKLEWQRRCQRCGSQPGQDATDRKSPGALPPLRSRDEEIARIHLRACGGDQNKASRLTSALHSIDAGFLQYTQGCIDQFDQGTIDRDEFRIRMKGATDELFSDTIRTVGLDMTRKIYPNCILTTEDMDRSPEIEEEPVGTHVVGAG